MNSDLALKIVLWFQLPRNMLSNILYLSKVFTSASVFNATNASGSSSSYCFSFGFKDLFISWACFSCSRRELRPSSSFLSACRKIIEDSFMTFQTICCRMFQCFIMSRLLWIVRYLTLAASSFVSVFNFLFLVSSIFFCRSSSFCFRILAVLLGKDQ